MSDEDKKPDTQEADQLNLKVKSQDGNAIYFKVKKTTPFSRILDAFCKRTGKDRSTVKFLFDGARIQENSTPADVRNNPAITMHAFLELVLIMSFVTDRHGRSR